MFFAEERRPIVQAMILADNDADRQVELDKLLTFQRADFEAIFKALKGRPATIRLIDPPLHEFLPSMDSLIAEVATDKALGKADTAKEKLLHQVEGMHEINPMMGLRGCRLSIVFPQIVEMQTRAILEGALAAARSGVEVHPEIMIPLVGHINELKAVRKDLDRVANDVMEKAGDDKSKIDYSFGTMIEIPRAALTADKIAEDAEFFSFGTNDLTQMTFGFSRDDSDKFLKPYVAQKILPGDPFESIDQDGVGQLMEIAVERGKKTRPGIKLGICGEHGGEPASIAFCHKIGLNYVSCSLVPRAHRPPRGSAGEPSGRAAATATGNP